ncbi:MAG: PRC-barrel domain-containing protein [Verrucomicrobia bacterium]|nr:PRC-barrel domain-containing protein [Verrucomicrobiota bacterium]
MLKNINDIYGTRVAATDGNIGHVRDFYFDDQKWIIRYMIVDTGNWLPGRQVLLSPHAFDGFGPDGDAISVRLTKDQIENSPSIESHRPVTRQYEHDYFHYYSWPPYWDNGSMWGVGEIPVLLPPPVLENLRGKGPDPRDDIHLRSTQSVTGYDIAAADGSLGSVAGFLVDHISWAILNLVVETGHWYSGKRILISTSAVQKISYAEAKVMVKLTRADLQRTHEDEVATVAASCPPSPHRDRVMPDVTPANR